MGRLVRAATVNLSSDVSAACRRLVDAGAESAEFSIDSLQKFTGDHLSDLLVQAAKHASAAGLRVACVSLTRMPVEPAVSDTTADRGSMVILDQLVCASGDIGAGVISIPPPAVMAANQSAKTVGYREALNCLYRVLDELSPAAERSSLFLGIRAPCYGCLLSPVEVSELIDAIASPCVGVSLDVLQLAEIGRVDDWLTVLGNHVVSVRSSLEMLPGVQTAVEAHLSGECILVVDESP